MPASLDGLSLVGVNRSLYRNVVSLRISQDLFDDLSDDPSAQAAAISIELETKPRAYRSSQPIIERPFEEAEFVSAILYPFEPGHWSESRFSRGAFGVWYGSEDMDTTIYETVYHWRNGLLADAGWERLKGVSMERRVHRVSCSTHLINLTEQTERWPELRSNDYTFCQRLGSQASKEGQPGFWTPSARCNGDNAVLFTPDTLTAPATVCYLTYTLDANGVNVSREREQLYLRVCP